MHEVKMFEDSNYEINQWVQKLDDVARGFEARWGVGRLTELVPMELKLKWERQVEKLNDAIDRRNVPLVRELAQGTIRAWSVLEAAAIASGSSPVAPECWEARSPTTGAIYRFTRNLNEARACTAQGVSTWSLEEVVRVLDKYATPLSQIKETLPQAQVAEIFDFKKGDEIPL